MTQKLFKAATLFGLNKYGGGNDLAGCVNDVMDRYHRLDQYYKFPRDNIRLLLDGRATKKEMINRLEWLIDFGRRQEPNESRLVVLYSGHGTQFRDWSGDELNDHLDEALCPIDCSFDLGAKSFILDDELAAIFKKLSPHSHLTVLLDSCHSGDGTREFGNPSYRKAKYLRPPLDIRMRSTNRELATKKLGRGWLNVEPGMNHMLISGCRSNQTSADASFGVEGRANGAFSWALMQAEDKGTGRTWLQLMEDLEQILKTEGFDQIPQVEGPARFINGYPF